MVTVEEGLNSKNSIILRYERFNQDRQELEKCSLFRSQLPPTRALL